MRTAADIQDLLQQVLALVCADEAQVAYSGSHSLATRFAENAITQNLSTAEEGLRLYVAHGRCHGSAITNKLDPAALRELVRRATDIAANAPEDPEALPVPGPQTYPPVPPRYFAETAALTPADLARGIATAIAPAAARGYRASGLHTAGTSVTALASSRGLFVSDRATTTTFATTAHGPAGSGSAAGQSHRTDLAVDAIAARALADAVAAQQPRPLAPGDYTVILEPDAVANLLAFLCASLDARDAEEGTTCLAGQLGQQLCHPRVNLTTDLREPALPACPYGEDGLPARHTAWIANGVLNRLFHNRFWAGARQTHPDVNLYPLVLGGGPHPVSGLVAQCARGLLVKHLWYIRYVDERELLLTGMTRDGLFLVERGEIVAPVRNLRFNESPLVVLRNLLDLGQAERVNQVQVPAVMSAEFTFSSTTESV